MSTKHFILFKISLAMKEMQITTTLKFHFTPVRTPRIMATLLQHRASFYSVGRNVK